MKTVMTALAALALAAGAAHAKLPPPSEEAKTAAELAKEKAAWSAKVAAYHLCQAQNRVAERYRKKEGDKKAAADLPACADPGPFKQASAGAEGGGAKPAQSAQAGQAAQPAQTAQPAQPAQAAQSGQATAPAKK